MQPHLKGLHLAEDAWRPNRGADGWKLSGKEQSEMEDDFDEDEWSVERLGFDQEVEPDAPETVPKLPRLQEDVVALRSFFEPETLVQCIVRPVVGAFYVAYGAGDASGEGFGASIHPLGLRPLLRHGFWCTEAAEESSNWREFRNLLDAVRVESESGRLVGCELWLATDNSTAASAYYKGTTSSEKLQNMVTELRGLTLKGNFVLNIFHIAGTRMIQIGIDGLSRGEMQLGALASTPHSAAPLHVSPLEPSPALVDWLHQWLGINSKIAKPYDWFHAAQQAGAPDEHREFWIWDLAPAAALYALEELGTARLKRHGVLQGVVLVGAGAIATRVVASVDPCYRLLFHHPGGQHPRMADRDVRTTNGCCLLAALQVPALGLNQVPFLVPLGITLSQMYKESPASTRPLLRKFWSATKQVSVVRESLLCRMLQDGTWYQFLGLSTV
jgi:hypothetical protein